MKTFADPRNIIGGTVTFHNGGFPAGTTVIISYPYEYRKFKGYTDVRGNNHLDINRLSELQKLVAKHPQRTDLKIELMKLQSRIKPKIGRKKKGKK